MDKACKRCGRVFKGSKHAWYCPKCKVQVVEEHRKKDLERIKEKRIEGICVICGKHFFSYVKKSTCGRDCDLKLKAQIKTGHKVERNARNKIADANCISWHLISPEGKHYEFNNLTQWARENCKLFEFEYSERNVKKIVSGISQVKGAMLGINTCKTSTYKGWKIVIVYGPNEICALYRNGMSINKIHSISNMSTGKIKKILITYGLYKNELSEKIEALVQEGKTVEEITSILQISENVVNIHTPYSKAVYNYKMSENALRIKKSRLSEKK